MLDGLTQTFFLVTIYHMKKGDDFFYSYIGARKELDIINMCA